MPWNLSHIYIYMYGLMFSGKNAIFYGDRISLGYLLALIFAQLAWPTPLAN